MKKISLLLLISALLFGNASLLRAQVFYDNGAAVLNSALGIGWLADTNNPQGETEVGDVFTAPTSATVNTVSFAAVFANGSAPGTLPDANSFLISLYSGGAPSTSVTPITSTLSDVTVTALGIGHSRTVYEFTGILNTPLTFTVGAAYYLGINDTTTPYEGFAVAQTANPISQNGYYLTNGGFAHYQLPLSFSLATTPEPSSWSLMAVAGMTLLAVRWSARRFL